MTTVILGSKPSPILPATFDTIVYVNGSISYSNNLPDNLQSYHIIQENFLKPKASELHTQTNRMCIQNKKVIKCILTQTSTSNDYYDIEFRDKLNELNYSFLSFESLSREDKWVLAERIVGKQFINMVLLKTKGWKLKMVYAYRFLLKSRTIKVGISSGVFAILYALIHGLGDGPYVICGIGLENDGYHYDQRLKFPRGHIEMDYWVLKKIAGIKRYNSILYTTDRGLSDKTGISFYPNLSNV